MQKIFDRYLAEGKTSGYVTERHYPDGRVEQKEPYYSYMTGSLFDELIAEMKNSFPDAYEQYALGNGDELISRTYKNKKTGVIDIIPPKMASYGSSSLMTYLKFRHVRGFKFEYKLDTTFNKSYPACLDGYREREDEYVFIESKCHEIYGGSHYPFEVSKSYYRLYKDYLSSVLDMNIEIGEGSKIKVKIKSKEAEIKYLDIKQIICHLLGIGKFLENKKPRKKVTLIYFLFSPKEQKIDNAEILQRYDRVKKEISSVDFNSLFEVICSYLRNEKQIKIDTGWDFSFKACHQNNVLGELE